MNTFISRLIVVILAFIILFNLTLSFPVYSSGYSSCIMVPYSEEIDLSTWRNVKFNEGLFIKQIESIYPYKVKNIKYSPLCEGTYNFPHLEVHFQDEYLNNIVISRNIFIYHVNYSEFYSSRPLADKHFLTHDWYFCFDDPEEERNYTITIDNHEVRFPISKDISFNCINNFLQACKDKMLVYSPQCYKQPRIELASVHSVQFQSILDLERNEFIVNTSRSIHEFTSYSIKSIADSMFIVSDAMEYDFELQGFNKVLNASSHQDGGSEN